VTRCRNTNLLPFRHWGQTFDSHCWEIVAVHGVNLWLRIDSLMINCCYHETFLHFGLQGSHLNICYYHQDLH
jgi:hypothetical protein